MISLSSSSLGMPLFISQPRNVQLKGQPQVKSGKAETHDQENMMMWLRRDVIGNLAGREGLGLASVSSIGVACNRMVLSWAFFARGSRKSRHEDTNSTPVFVCEPPIPPKEPPTARALSELLEPPLSFTSLQSVTSFFMLPNLPSFFSLSPNQSRQSCP